MCASFSKMATFEKIIKDTLVGKPPANSTSEPVQFDLSKNKRTSCGETQAMLKRNLTIIVAAVIMDESNSNVLLIQEAKRECRGQWYLPAGRLEENETLEVRHLIALFMLRPRG